MAFGVVSSVCQNKNFPSVVLLSALFLLCSFETVSSQIFTLHYSYRRCIGWYQGERMRDDQRGWFPGNYTVEIASSHVRARNLRQRYRLLALSGNFIEEQARKDKEENKRKSKKLTEWMTSLTFDSPRRASINQYKKLYFLLFAFSSLPFIVFLSHCISSQRRRVISFECPCFSVFCNIQKCIYTYSRKS